MKAHANGIEIEYDTFGDPAAAPLLLIMGLGAQMIGWQEAFCARLAGRGFHVIRFDNRDVGLSTKFASFGSPDMVAAFTAFQRGDRLVAPYTLADMAADAAGLLDALGIRAAHIVGASMGGMIAQEFALLYPTRTLTLTSIMSTTSEPDIPLGTAEATGALMAPRPSDRTEYIESQVVARHVLAGGGFPWDETEARRLAGIAYDRSYHPEGMARQMLAIVASGGRRDRLRGLRVPALVIHGAADPLVPLAGGLDTHNAIAGSQMLVIEGMGHELPEGSWPPMIEAIGELSRSAAKV